ncbi:MAG TPA: acyl-CoA thioesterase, partial [Planctomycetaceae bacterium]|nr:acyl-CoA thioesterase [Planctomycetaceae bacterium]
MKSMSINLIVLTLLTMFALAPVQADPPEFHTVKAELIKPRQGLGNTL